MTDETVQRRIDAMRWADLLCDPKSVDDLLRCADGIAAFLQNERGTDAAKSQALNSALSLANCASGADPSWQATLGNARRILSRLVNGEVCQCGACSLEIRHAGGCVVHWEPAVPGRSCDCGALAKAERRYGAWAAILVCSRLAHQQTLLRSWWWRVCRRR